MSIMRRGKSRARPANAPGDPGSKVPNAVLAILPWSVALLLHASLILIAAFVAWNTIPASKNDITPTLHFSEAPAEQLQVQADRRLDFTLTDRPIEQADPADERQLTDLETRLDQPPALVGLEGGQTTMFDATAVLTAALTADFLGVRGNARRLVFCIDASGSLIDTMPYLIAELEKSIEQLSDQQQFTVLFFQADRVIEVPPRGMRDATAANRQSVIDWIAIDARNVVPQGRSNPVNAIRRAMAYQPELIYLLSDNITGSGRYETSQSELLREIERANVADTKINTIQFLYPDPLAQRNQKGTMERIADQSGGLYRFISAEDLRLR